MVLVRRSANQIIRRLADLDRRGKVSLQIAADTSLALGCCVMAMVIRLEDLSFLVEPQVWLVFAVGSAAAVATQWRCGLYRTLVRYLTGNVLGAIGRGAVAFVTVMLLLSTVLGGAIPRSVPILAGCLLLMTISSLRFFIKQAFQEPLHVSKRPVAVYGAGEAGLELVNLLHHGRHYAPIAFIDDDKELHGLLIGGCRVYPASALPELVESAGLDSVLLALPNINPGRRRQILAQLEKLPVEVKTIPSMSEVVSGKSKISELRHINPDELLGRDPVPPDQKLLGQNINNKVVMVTGAGGSIGSELCRQILDQKPAALLLFEISELALYTIEDELLEKSRRLELGSKIIPILGSVRDQSRIESAIKAFKVQTIFHAAAYKHVPIVEENVIEGIRNNVFGTLALARVAEEQSVDNFVLISTDKAVRPTNVMGATKRIAELVCQGFAQKSSHTVYSMVRFGNVLGSSGSVVPRFMAQIESGGPVTVTHPEITRYFMTIPEAAQLVIQAGSMAKGGDVFVLNMGEPVKIADLAAAMIKLHGMKPYFVDGECDEADQGDIQIQFVGLRKGEKLYEELLIGNDPKPTEHPRVMSASEVSVPFIDLMATLTRLKHACDNSDIPEISSILKKMPLDFTPRDTHFNDLIWNASFGRRDSHKVMDFPSGAAAVYSNALELSLRRGL